MGGGRGAEVVGLLELWVKGWMDRIATSILHHQVKKRKTIILLFHEAGTLVMIAYHLAQPL